MESKEEAGSTDAERLERIRELIGGTRPGSFNPGWWFKFKNRLMEILDMPPKDFGD